MLKEQVLSDIAVHHSITSKDLFSYVIQRQVFTILKEPTSVTYYLILWHFSKERVGTPFDNNFIRLQGSLGEGRIAAYRRQVKYKLLAAIELGLITDIRALDERISYTPALTPDGEQLWTLIRPFVDTDDLVLEEDSEGTYSSTTPQSPHYYNDLIRRAQVTSSEFANLSKAILLNMPAVRQMLQFLYQTERTRVVQKTRIYENFFQTEPVQVFCDAMGIKSQPTRQRAEDAPCYLIFSKAAGLLCKISLQ